MVAVAVRVDDEDGPVRETARGQPDVRDPEPGVDEDGPFAARDEETVDMTGLTDQPGARFEFFEREPAVPSHRRPRTVIPVTVIPVTGEPSSWPAPRGPRRRSPRVARA